MSELTELRILFEPRNKSVKNSGEKFAELANHYLRGRFFYAGYIIMDALERKTKSFDPVYQVLNLEPTEELLTETLDYLLTVRHPEYITHLYEKRKGKNPELIQTSA